jgi:hypothetical protein
MPEPVASHNELESAAKRGNDPPMRSRFQFSLRSLLLFILIVALALTSVLMYRRMAAAEKEAAKLRNIAGYLNIEDESQIYAIAMETYDLMTWRWRVYLPADHKYIWHYSTGDISAGGIPESVGSALDSSTKHKGRELIVNLALQKTSDNNWYLKLSRKSADEARFSTSFSVSNDVMNQLLHAGLTEKQCIGEKKAVSSKIDAPIIFMKLRTGEKQPNGSWKSSPNPTPGIMIWLEAVP